MKVFVAILALALVAQAACDVEKLVDKHMGRINEIFSECELRLKEEVKADPKLAPYANKLPIEVRPILYEDAKNITLCVYEEYLLEEKAAKMEECRRKQEEWVRGHITKLYNSSKNKMEADKILY